MELLVAVITAILPAGVGGTIVVGTLTVASLIATGLVLAGSLAFSMAQASKAKEKAREDYNAAQVDRLQNTVTNIAPRELVMGRVRKGGAVGFRGSAGALKDKFLAFLSLADHRIDAVEAVYLNDQEVTLDAQGRVLDAPYHQNSKETFRQTAALGTGTYNGPPDSEGAPTYVPVNTVVQLTHPPIAGSLSVVIPESGQGNAGNPDYVLTWTLNGQTLTIHGPNYPGGVATVNYSYTLERYYAKIWWSLGGDDVIADPRIEELFPGLWSPAHRGRGVAKLFAEFTFNETAFPSGAPNVTARIRGAKLYDPRTGLTEWSENPALMVRHVYQHPWFGKADVSPEEDARIIAAANACDIVHGYDVEGAAVENNPLYTAAIVIPYGTTAASAFKDLCAAMAGGWDYAGGELYVHAGVWSPPVFTLTDDDLALSQISDGSESSETISVVVHRERAEKFNVVNLRIWDGGHDFKLVGLPPLRAPALIAADGAELAQELSLQAVSYAPQALHVAGVMMRDARDPVMLEAPFKMRAYPLEVFDTVRVSLARYGFELKTFRIMRREWHQDRGFVKLAMKEITAAIYTPDAKFKVAGYADNTSLPRSWDINPPNITGIFSGTNELVAQSDGSILTRVRVKWAPINDARITEGGRVEVQWRPVGDDDWLQEGTDGASTQLYLIGPRDNRHILVRARTRNLLAVSPWSDVELHQVVGKTALPQRMRTPVTVTPEGRFVRIAWPKSVEADVRVYEWRTADAGWGDDNYLWRGSATSFRTLPPPPGGSMTWYGKQVDTTGHYSELSRSVAYARVLPGNVGAVTTDVVRGKISFDFADVAQGSHPLRGYELRPTDSGWGTDGYLWRGQSSKTPYVRMTPGVNHFYFKAYDEIDEYSAVAKHVTHTYDRPPNLTTLALSRRLVNLRMVAGGATEPSDLKHYEFRIKKNGVGDVWNEAVLDGVVLSPDNIGTWQPTGFGTYRVSVRMVDVDNNAASASMSASITITRPPKA